MRTLICFLTICSLAVTQGLSQVKIGDNPQNIDASSILELESSSRVFIITRVNSSEMNTITPLRGALVYNTDEQCVFYYDGGQWSNLCAEENTTNVSFELVDDELVLTDSDGNTVSVPLEGVGEQSFTAEPIVNFRETIIITQTGNTFNFEVGQITGENIADSTIQGVDFAPESITQDKIAPASIGTSELQDNAVTDDDIDFFSADAVTLNDFTNDAGFITAAQLISPDANNAITDSNGAFYNDSPLLNDIANNNQRITDHLSLDNDLDDQNERLTNAILDGNELVLTEGGIDTRINLGPLNNAGTDNQNLSLNANRIEIDNATGVDLTALLAANNISVNPVGNITSTDVQEALEELQVDINNLNAGGGNTDEQTLATDNTPGNISITNGGAAITLNVNDGDFDPNNEIQDALEVDINPITGITGNNVQLALEELQTDVDNLVSGGGADGVVSNVTFDGTDLNFTGANGGFDGAVDISALAGGGADGVVSNVGLTGNELVFTGAAGGFNGNIDLTPILGGANTDEQDLSLAGNTLNITNGAGVDLTPILGATNTDEQELTLLGDDLSIDNGNTVDLSTIDNQTASEVIFTPYVTLPGPSTQLAIQQLKDELDTATIAGGGENPTNELQDIELTGTVVTLTIPATLGNQIDLDPTFVTETELGIAIALKEDTANKSIDVTLADATNTLFPTELAVKTYVDTQVGAIAAPTIVSDDAGNSISASVVDGGAFFDDTALTTATTTNTTAIALKEDTANKSIDVTLADATNTLFPTELAVKTYVDTQIGGITTGNNLSNFDLIQTADRLYDLDENNLTFDITNSAITFIGTNSNFGIGNITPQDKLDVDGQIRARNGFAASEGTAGNPGYGFHTGNDTNMGMYRIAADQLGFSTDGIEAMRIDAVQNVIINQGLELDGTLTDINGLNGTAGQILSSTGAAVVWIDAPIGGGGVSVTARLTGDGQVATPLDIADDAITTIKINDAAVTTAKIANGEVQTANIADNNVTPAKIQEGADGQVLITNGTDVQWGAAPAGASLTGTTIDGDGTTGNVLELADDAVTTAKILDGTIESADMGENSVTSFSINNNTIFNLDINTNAAIQGTKINPNFGGQDIATTGNLTVGGTVTVQGVPVHPDYVFQKYFTGFSNLKNDYYLLTLQEVESFIKKHHHLPGIKSAKEFEEQGGFDLGKASKINLEKIEELFLHTIEQEKKIETLHSENKELSEELNSLKSEIELIKSMLIQKQND